jgi:hypothetical protein
MDHTAEAAFDRTKKHSIEASALASSSNMSSRGATGGSRGGAEHTNLEVGRNVWLKLR